MNAWEMTPEKIYGAAVDHSIKNLMFIGAWAAAIVYLLSRLSWWLGFVSFAILIAFCATEIVRLCPVAYALPTVTRSTSSGIDRGFLRGAVIVQLAGTALSLALCAWVYFSLFP